MKKILYFSFFMLLLGAGAELVAESSEREPSCFDLDFTAGYAFKNDSRFKEVYGHGMINMITGDGCFYPWKHGGIGAKMSYWRTKGKTTFMEYRSIIREIPVTVYARGRKNFSCGLELHGSLGAGFAWIKEKSYLGHVQFYKGLGELEAGLRYPIWRCIEFTAAVRYLFPPQVFRCEKVDVGGVDLRAGIGFSF
jgi:hypothetical protein